MKRIIVFLVSIAMIMVAKAQTNKSFSVNGVSFTMVYVQGGTFTMGATVEQGSDIENDQKPTHDVTLSSFFIGQTEVTQELWQTVMGKNPSKFKGNKHPVENVSWNDCVKFIKKLNKITKQNFRLPTEAEWEFAARGGIKSQGYMFSGGNMLNKIAWYGDNAGWGAGSNSPDFGTHNVATKAPNELGIYDMSGNVYEWCQDWYGNYSSGSQVNPQGPTKGNKRILRGGDWLGKENDNWEWRVASRASNIPKYIFYGYGFRLAL